MFKYVLSIAIAVGFASAATIDVLLQSSPLVHIDNSSVFDMKSASESSLAPLSLSALASVSAEGGTGQVFQNIGASFLNLNNGTMDYNDGWSFVNASNAAANVSSSQLLSFYQFTLDNTGSVTVNWSSSSFGSNLFGLFGMLVTIDPTAQPTFFATDITGGGSFTKELTAGTHTLAFSDGSNFGFGGAGSPPSTVDAHLHETFVFSITGTVEPPSPVPEPSTWSLLGIGLMFFLAAPIRRMHRTCTRCLP